MIFFLVPFYCSYLFSRVSASIFDITPAHRQIEQILGRQSVLYKVISPPIPVPFSSVGSSREESLRCRPVNPMLKVLNRKSHPVVIMAQYYQSEEYFSDRRRRFQAYSMNESIVEVPTRKLVEEDGMKQIKDFIENETLFYSNSKNNDALKRGAQIRRTLGFILNDDYKGFIADRPNFLASFNQKHYVIRNGDGGSLLHTYAVKLGASNIFTKIVRNRKHKVSDFGEAMAFLINTSPLSKVTRMFEVQFILKQEDHVAIRLAVESKYPTFHFLDYLAFEYLDRTALERMYASNILKADTEEKKFAVFTQLLDTQMHLYRTEFFDFRRINRIPSMFPEYFKTLSDTIKFYFGQLAIEANDMECLYQVVNLAPNILLHSNRLCFATGPEFHEANLTLFHLVIINNKLHFIPIFLKLVPELFLCSSEKFESILAFAICHQKFEAIDSFITCGIDVYNIKLLHVNYGSLNPLQHCFLRLNIEAFKYFISKAKSREQAVANLLSIFGSNSAIINYALVRLPKDSVLRLNLIDIFANQLGIYSNSDKQKQKHTLGNTLPLP